MFAWMTSHPRSVGETYTEHAGVAVRAGAMMTVAGLACLVHALLPFAFRRAASTVVLRLHAEMAERQRRHASKQRLAAVQLFVVEKPLHRRFRSLGARAGWIDERYEHLWHDDERRLQDGALVAGHVQRT